MSRKELASESISYKLNEVLNIHVSSAYEYLNSAKSDEAYNQLLKAEEKLKQIHNDIETHLPGNANIHQKYAEVRSEVLVIKGQTECLLGKVKEAKDSLNEALSILGIGHSWLKAAALGAFGTLAPPVVLRVC